MPPNSVPSSVSRALAGQSVPLPSRVRERGESFFGADLAFVHVHTGDAAVRANRDLDAVAFTVGSDIALGDSADSANNRVLAHELTHALQPPSMTAARVISLPGDHAQVGATQLRKLLDLRGHGFRCRFKRTDYEVSTQHDYPVALAIAPICAAWRSLLLFTDSDMSLIRPPEVWTVAGGFGVLVKLTAPEIAALFASNRATAEQFAIDIAQRHLKVNVASVTLSACADQDFTRPNLPHEVARARGLPVEGATSDQKAGVEAARSSAATTAEDLVPAFRSL